MATSYDGVPGDIDMEMEEHLIELAKRFLLVFAIIGVVTLVSYPVTDNIIGVLKAKFVPPGINVITINPVEIVFTRLKIAVVISLLAGAPLIVYETFAFMRPGLYPSEKRFFYHWGCSLLYVLNSPSFSPPHSDRNRDHHPYANSKPAN
jgi:sec-independent protein translocase protein TatC